jgi:hypothetical protein
MSASSSVQSAHDELLAAMPSGATHDPACTLCHSAAGAIEQAKEGASVADAKYTEEQHVAILTDAVARETAQLTSVKDELDARVEVLETEKAEAATALTDAQNKIDVLESEKAAETARADAAEQARSSAVETAKIERAEAVKKADPSLADVEDYFSEERVARWAEMADDQFQNLIADLTEAAAKRKPPAKGDDDEKTPPWLKEKSRETAAFAGGEAPTSAGEGSTLNSFLQVTGKLPASASN